MKVQSQGRAYAAVIGVTVGMLLAGLAVPLAFGRTPEAAPLSAHAPEMDFGNGDAGLATAPGQGGGKGRKGGSTPGTIPGAPLGSAPGTAPGTTPGGGASTTPSGSLTATDQGVTATKVKIGVILLDVESLEPLGLSVPHFSPREQREQFQAFIDEVNKAGGLSGRKIEPVFATVNALDSNGSQSPAAVCSKLAEDEKVFAAMGFVTATLPECLSQQFGIPVLSDQGRVAESYQKKPGFIVSYKPSAERGAANWGELAARSGILEGRKIGTVYMDNVDESRAEAALVSALSSAGVSVTTRGRLGGDAATAQSQLPIVVQEMRTAGVNTVFLATNFVAALQFVQTAENQGFRPQYVVSDFGSLTVKGLVSRMPASFNGAIGITAANATSPEATEDAKCRMAFNKNTGNSYAAGDTGGVRTACFVTRVLTAAGARVGANLTRAGIAGAFQQLGSPALPLTLGGSFRAGKTDYSDYFRPVRYATSCKCYNAAGGAQKGKY